MRYYMYIFINMSYKIVWMSIIININDSMFHVLY